jgi:predicted short-subunit dehydrogenase-like oxidoreductase (DUF2520 family)
MHSLNIIGCGKVGQTLGGLLRSQDAVSTITILNRSPASSLRAAQHIGGSTIAHAINELPPASLWMIATPDKDIPSVAQQLAASSALESNSTVFHCAGSKDSHVLSILREKTTNLASLHLIRSFADPAHDAQAFTGTLCGIEGSLSARSILEPLLTRIGARIFEISADSKMLCHIGHVFASNYLVVLVDCARRLYSKAGIPEPIALEFMQSIMEGTLHNTTLLGTTNALTGPIVRGEKELVKEQLTTLASMSDPSLKHLLDLYRALAEGALVLTKDRNSLSHETLEALKVLLNAE